jgi:hypothetical protein
MVKLGLLISLLGLTVAAMPAMASTHDAKERAAKRACLNGDPAKGVKILTDLYIATEDPVYLFNQGRCYEQNNRYEDAIGRFREFLRKTTGTSASDKADTDNAKKHISDCEALLGHKVTESTQTAAPPPAHPAPVPPPPPPLPPQPQPQPQRPMGTVAAYPAPVSDPSAGSGLRVAGIATAAVGVAAIVTGLVLNLEANSKVSDLQKHYDDGSYSTSKDYKTGSQIAYGAGAVCVAGGVLLYYLGLRAGNTVVAPVALQGGAAAMLTGAF